MPKLVYLYTSGGAPKCDIGHSVDFDVSQPTTNRFALAARSDGMIHMFSEMARLKHIYRFVAIIDSTRSPGSLHLGLRSKLFVTPSMSWAKTIVLPGDILIVRGGFKPWIPFLDYIYKRRENWVLFYRANTNRHSWPFWDITLNDLIDKPKSIRGRLHYDFTKPVNEDIFGIIDAPGVLPREYDVMIGASHIHRRKGQYLTVQALQKYYHKYGIKPHAIMPGGYMRCSTNTIIQNIIQSGDVDIEGPLNLPRRKLSLLMNETKLFVHAGYGGQNDRCILEAMCCGCLPLLYGKAHVTPAIWDNSIHILQEPDYMSDVIHTEIEWPFPYDTAVYSKINGLHEVAIPKMRRLLSFIENHPVPDRHAACARFVG